MRPFQFVPVMAITVLCGLPPAMAQTAAQGAGDTARMDLINQGWGARQLLGQTARAKADDRLVGTVGDLIVDADGRLAAVVVESSSTAEAPEAVRRIPWTAVDLTAGQDGVRVDLRPEAARYGLFPGSESVPTLPREFRLSELIGDYARLQAGYGYGRVTDAVFTTDGRLAAVLVTRDAAVGGGTSAFPFPGTAGPWDPGLNYYGLPFVTQEQARGGGHEVDPSRFRKL